MKHTLFFLAVAGIASVLVARAEPAPLHESDPETTRAIDIRVPSSRNPRNGVAVKIDRVLDKRNVDPYTVGRGPKKIIVLSSQTVPDLVEKAVTSGLRRAGYRVLRESDPGYAEAAPLEVTIMDFWATKPETDPQDWYCATKLALLIYIRGPLEPFSGSGLSLWSTVDKSGFWIACSPRFETVLTKAVKRIREDVASKVQGLHGLSRVASRADANLLRAVKRGDLQAIREAVFDGANIDTRDKSGRTALMLASKRGYVQATELLIQSGAHVDALDDVGKTALTHARDRAIIDLLLANGAATP